ncbi:MAG: SatD family protein [Candidatus Krumholzibacteriia bacterium]
MASTLYIAIIGDLVGSRDIAAPERRRLQDRLAARLATARSPEAVPGMASRPLITLGDEFQGLYTADDAGVQRVLELIPAVVDEARPTAARFGLGVGTLTTAVQREALGMDGPCFHRARAALEQTRALDVLCQLHSGAGALDELWSTAAAYALRQRHEWTDAQHEAIALYLELGEWKQVAARLGVSPSAVSLRHKAAGWTRYRRAWTALEHGLLLVVQSHAAVGSDERSAP